MLYDLVHKVAGVLDAMGDIPMFYVAQGIY
jgi:hypothetical protein